MTTATAQLRPPRHAAAGDLDVAALEEALAGKRRGLRFAPALEAAYEHDTGKARSWRQIVCNLLGLANFWLLSGGEALVRHPAWATLLPMRILVTTAGLGCVLLLWVNRASGRGGLRESLTSLGTLLIVAYAVTAVGLVGTLEALMQNAGLVLVFLHVGIAARLQVRFALGVNVIAYLGYALFARGDRPETELVLQNHLLLFSLVLVFTTVANYLLEARERRAYLLDCLKTRRHEALLADAEALRELTERDALTGLANRRRFDAELARAWGRGLRDATPVGLLQVDVDHFKRYNDHHGHVEGDRCLIDVAATLGALAERHGGVAARSGGEEFALLLPGLDAAAVEAVGAEVCAAVRALGLPHPRSRCADHVTVSAGAAAIVPAAGLWASSLIGAADAALYAAKGAGRDRCARFKEPVAPASSPRRRKTHDSLAPEPDAPADDLVRIDRLSALLAGGVRLMRLPADLETEFHDRRAPQRRRQLALLTAAGLALTLLYIVLCRPVFPDIADRMLRQVVALSIGALALATVNYRFAFGWRLRESLFAGVVAIFGVAMVGVEASSTSPTVYSATLGLCLLPMFAALVAAQSMRFSIVPSVVICAAIGLLMHPDEAARHAAWKSAFGIVTSATVYSLVGGYLLEFANRRAFLLDRLRVAQLAVLRHNTEHLQRLATLDPLTRLPNRRHFEAELDRLAAACSSAHEPLGLLILDIDHFKPYNDGYGHPAGDACLQRVGRALADWAQRAHGAAPAPSGRPVVPARIGGEEFGVLLPGSDAPGALAAAQRLRVALRELKIEHAHSPAGRFVTVSIGAASLVLESAADARLLLKAADAALYRAKGLGRDQAAA